MPDQIAAYRQLLHTAHAALRSTVAGVAPERWPAPTPCQLWNATQVLQHAAGDQLAYAAMLTGQPGPRFNPFAPSGELDEAPGAFLEPFLQASAAAWAAVGDDATDVSTPLPIGPLLLWLGLGACALDAAVHAWDLAVATGQPSPLTPADASLLQAVADRVVEPLRGFAYAPALPAAGSEDAVAALLRYLGRQPDWRSPAGI